MTPQLAERPDLVDQEVVEERVQCDACSATAQVICFLPYGELAFCLHHYNKNAQALTDQGGIAKLLSIAER